MPVYMPNRAMDVVKRYIRNERIMDLPIWERIRQSASDYIWNAAPWRWTIGRIGPIVTTASVSEYLVENMPEDFAYLVDAYLTDGKTTWRQLRPVPIIGATEHQGEPVKIAYEDGSLIIAPAPSVSGWRLYAYYKKTPPVTAGWVPGELKMPDYWVWVYELALLTYAYLYADDVRAGSVQVNVAPNGVQIQYSGMLARLEAALEFMKSREPMPVPVARSAP